MNDDEINEIGAKALLEAWRVRSGNEMYRWEKLTESERNTVKLDAAFVIAAIRPHMDLRASDEPAAAQH